MRTSSRISWVALFSLLLQFWVVASAGTIPPSPRKPGDTNAGKISPDMRERIRAAGPIQPTVGVVLQLDGRPSGRLNALLNRNGVHVRAEFEHFDSLALDVPLNVVEELASFDEVSYVSPDREVRLLGHVSTTTGLDAARAQAGASLDPYGVDGSGVDVAVLDSGIYNAHKSFAGHYAGGKDYTGEGRTDDPHGHGTHVASIAAGGAGAVKGKYVGIAPNATVYNLRVLNSLGVGRVSGVLLALDDLLNYHKNYNIRVVNMSLGMPAVDSYKDDPVCLAVRKLVDAGVVVVAAAGNNGKDEKNQKVYGRIHSPGNEPSAITVGASNDSGTIDRGDDVVASYSSRGPTRSSWTDEAGMKHYDHFIKPELVAPGNKIVAAEAVSNYLVRLNPALDAGVSKFDNQKMMRLSGSSMATPVVAGAAALLL